MTLMTDVVLPSVLAFILFSLGLGLTIDDFLRVARWPRGFLTGCLAQVVVLPALAFLLVLVWPMPSGYKLGLMIVAAAPGGITAGLLTAFARGDVALSISLTAVISLLSAISVPIVLVLAYPLLFDGMVAAQATVAVMAIGAFALATAPVLLGVGVRRLAPDFAARVEPAARRISAALFVLVLAGAVYRERAEVARYAAEAGLVTLALNVAAMGAAWTIARLLGASREQRIALTITCGIQNGAIAVAVAALLFGGGPATVPAAAYGLIMFATALIFVAFVRRGMPAAG